MDRTILQEMERATNDKTPFEGSWTAAQVAVHLLKSYGIVEILKIAQSKTDRAADENVEQLKSFFLNFNLKVKSAAAILPPENLINKENLLSSLKKRMTEIKK